MHTRLGGGARPDLLHQYALAGAALASRQIGDHHVQAGRAIVRNIVQRQFPLVLVRQLSERDGDFSLLTVANHG